MIQVVECHFEVIVYFLTNQNCDFFKVDKATIQVVEWHLNVIFCLLTSPKFDFGEVEKGMFQVVATHWELIFFHLPAQNATWVKSTKRCFKDSLVNLKSFSAS